MDRSTDYELTHRTYEQGYLNEKSKGHCESPISKRPFDVEKLEFNSGKANRYQNYTDRSFGEFDRKKGISEIENLNFRNYD